MPPMQSAYQLVARRVGTRRSELAHLESGEHVAGTPEVPVGKLPQAGLEYIRKFRDVKYHEALFEALSKQLEAARLDEAKAAPVIRCSIGPSAGTKSWPPGSDILGSTIAAILGSALYILVKSESPMRTIYAGGFLRRWRVG